MQENSYIKKYIETLSPEGFEQICVEYLQLKKGNQYIVQGTKFIKDGGKDIVGKASNDIPYEIWAECKKHTRSIGLEEISKNVVLVMSYGINELIFFSTSNITETAKLHISKVASKHDFSIGFYYGEKLYNELAILPIFSYSSKIQNDNQSINISVNLSKYKNPESYEKENFIKLTRDTTFYIYITIDNNSSYNMYDVCINIQDNSNMLFHISSYDNNFKLPTSCERIVQIQVDILNLKKILYIPNVEISYKTSDNNEKKSEFYVGNVDPTGLLYFPIISQKTNDYLSNVVQKSIGKYSDFSLFDIRGISGVGKTRLIKEISKIASFKNWNIINYDGKINKNFAPVKDLLCQLIGLPYLSHNINISPADIKNILTFHNDNMEFSNIIYNFIYKDIYDKETLYYIKNVFTYFLSRPYLSMPNILILDNFQDFNEIVIEFVQDLIEICNSIKTSIIICTSINIEDVPTENCNCIKNYFDFLTACPEDSTHTYIIEPLEINEAKLLFEQTLTNINSKSNLLNVLVSKCGTIPFDIIMQIKAFQDEKIIEWSHNNLWYIPDFEKFNILINSAPQGSINLIKRRLKLLKMNLVNSNKKESWEMFILITKYIMYFKNSVPISFLQYIDIDEETLIFFTELLFYKFDEDKPTIKFYHDNFYRYFSNIKLYSFDIKVAKQIIEWIEGDEYYKNDYNFVLLKCYIDISNYCKAKPLALKLINGNLNEYNYKSVISICNSILNDNHFELTNIEYFDITISLAEAYRGRVNHKKGAEIYYNLYKKTSDLKLTIPKSKENLFYKNAINSCINSDYLNYAKEILNHFISVQPNDVYYKFLIHDRNAVINLGLGNVNIALNEIFEAEKIANMQDNNIWKSIYLSDMGYIYYRGIQDKKETINCFKNAYNIIKNNIPYPNRKAELLQQYAFVELLNNDIAAAKNDVRESILICNELKETYLKSKAYNLKGIIELHCGNTENAVEIWNNNIELCQNINNHTCQIRTFSNLAAYYLSTHNIKNSIGYLNIALKLMNDSEFSYVHFKELIINYYRIALLKCEDDIIKYIRQTYTDKDLYENFEKLEDYGYDTEAGLLFFNGANFIF